MSLGLVLPTVALLGAAPEQPSTVGALLPVALIQSQAEVPSAAPVPQAGPKATPPAPPPTADVPPIALEPLPDPSATQATSGSAPVTVEATSVTTLERTPGDPLEGFNRHMFATFQSTDRKFFRPVAMGYKHIVPKPVRSGLRHFFSNLGEPLVFLNDLLQLKPGRAGKTLARFLFNSTIGVGGLIDVAKLPGLKLPHHDNSFGNTLAFYGVGPGPYLFLPFVGPTTLRDFLGGQGEAFVLPLSIGTPFDRWEYQLPRGISTGLDQRAENDADLKAVFDGAVDPYATLRSVYLQNRAAEVRALHGRSRAGAAANPLDDPLSDPAQQGASPLDDPLTDPAKAPGPAQPGDSGAAAATATDQRP